MLEVNAVQKNWCNKMSVHRAAHKPADTQLLSHSDVKIVAHFNARENKGQDNLYVTVFLGNTVLHLVMFPTNRDSMIAQGIQCND